MCGGERNHNDALQGKNFRANPSTQTGKSWKSEAVLEEIKAGTCEQGAEPVGNIHENMTSMLKGTGRRGGQGRLGTKRESTVVPRRPFRAEILQQSLQSG